MKVLLFLTILLSPLLVEAHGGHDETTSHSAPLPSNTQPIEPRQTLIEEQKTPSFLQKHKVEAAVGGLALVGWVSAFILKRRKIKPAET